MKKRAAVLILALAMLLCAGCGKARSSKTAELLSSGNYALRYTAVVSGLEFSGELMMTDGKMDESVTMGETTVRTIFDGMNWYSLDVVNLTYTATTPSIDVLGLSKLGELAYADKEKVSIDGEELVCERYTSTAGEVRFYIRDKAVAWMEMERRTDAGAVLQEKITIISLSEEVPVIALPGGYTEVEETVQTQAMYGFMPEYPDL
ncbi:MAG: hypothetical protein IJP30_03410 [Clostridia bacterium]|nr:hypothetical protein [Clostridia bacterium]